MKKILLFLIVSVILIPQTRADEGMWLLPLIEKLNIKDMKKAGFKLSAKDIYSINSSSIKDAVVIFGGGCTGEIISGQGLLLTNHHCGYGAIQQHSSVENDYLKDGFWAKNKSEEKPTPGLAVQFLERIEDVTDQIAPALKDVSSEEKRAEIIAKLSDSIAKNARNNTSHIRAYVSPMFGGNDFYLIVYKIYSDVRLVGAPPSSIGKFGADTDNWMWPRHTGDFSIFRVYSDANGNPADYSENNVPLRPKHHFPISLKGFKEGDFAMVMGFPGSTQRYMTSWEVDERISISNANMIKIRGIRQELMMEDMLADPKVKIQYATKYSGSSNYWKNSIGMSKALKKLKVIDQKRAQEIQFTNWTNADAGRKELYGNALSLIESAVKGRAKNLYARQYLSESVLRGCEIVSFANTFADLYNALQNGETQNIQRTVEASKEWMENFFKNYNQATDKKISAVMLKLYYDNVPQEDRPAIFDTIYNEYAGDFGKYVDYLFSNTFLLDKEKIEAFWNNPTEKTPENDIAIKLARSVSQKIREFQKEDAANSLKYREGHRKYVAGLREMYEGVRPVYPDANFTMRLTYGKISGYEPQDAGYFEHVTTAKGIIEKEDPDNWEFVVPEKLKQLIGTKDFGAYAMKDGRLPVNFIFSGDITGGNSGSPVLNAKGELIGTAFDGNWEAMSGDIAYETNLQRCINLDIRYTLFVIDKYADAKYLIDEMTIVK
ncbi:MAG: S46 family peptidase [Prevotellaceae bacterium]|nr:S46 family peptidase [Prevotellaceae bacterium]